MWSGQQNIKFFLFTRNSLKEIIVFYYVLKKVFCSGFNIFNEHRYLINRKQKKI